MVQDDPPEWPAETTLHAMRSARDRCLAAGGTLRLAAAAARDVALAHAPSLPARMIGEAVARIMAEVAHAARRTRMARPAPPRPVAQATARTGPAAGAVAPGRTVAPQPAAD